MNSSAGSNPASVQARVPGRADSARSLCGVAIAAMLVAGCKTDLNQQLLERELRMQEDQIYLLQDELQSKAARLERAVGENSSLKRQLGIADSGPATGRAGASGGAGGASVGRRPHVRAASVLAQGHLAGARRRGSGRPSLRARGRRAPDARSPEDRWTASGAHSSEA